MASSRPASQARTLWATPMPPTNSESRATSPRKRSTRAEVLAQRRLGLAVGLDAVELALGQQLAQPRSAADSSPVPVVASGSRKRVR